MPKTNHDIFNKKKLVYLPLLIGLFAIVTVGLFGFQTSKHFLLEQMEQDGINLAKLTTTNINIGNRALEVLNNLTEEKIKVAGSIVFTYDEGALSNDILRSVAKDTNVDEIYWFHPQGEVLFSSTGRDIGWKPNQEHPIENFRISDAMEYYDTIRMNTDTGLFYKYGYMRNAESNYIQVGIEASAIQQLAVGFNKQTIVENLAKDENTAYALIINPDLEAIADSDIEDIGIVYTDDEDYIGVLQGKTSTSTWYYDRIGKEVLEIAVPIMENGEVIGILGIGLLMDSVQSAIYFALVITVGLTAFMAMLFLYVQHENIIRPVIRLDESINQIDMINNRDYRIVVTEKDTFRGLSQSVNNMLDEINQVITLLRQKDEYIEHIAYHDSLTNLPNKRLFVEKLKEKLENHQSGAVILLGIDNFKGINDTFGHAYGDEVLKNVAELLLSIKNNRMLVSRSEGDKFLIVVEASNDVVTIEQYVNKIVALFMNYLRIEGSELFVTVSIGVTCFPTDSNNYSQLISNADMALHSAKETGKNGFRFFVTDMADKLNQRIKTENVVRDAIKNRSFTLLYQPQIDTETGEIVGFEALLRLRDYSISPTHFIPIAEETGMIIEIGRRVTTEAIQQLATWKKKGYKQKPIAINFSAKQLQDIKYAEFLQRELVAHDVLPELLELEITEGILFHRKDETIDFINQIKAIGVKVSIDDFGTGYSSLSYLTFLPIDKIKIDKSLFDEYLKTKNDNVIKGIIAIAHSINLKIVAEGIEEVEQYEMLKQQKCDYIQGFLFSKPLGIEEIDTIYGTNLFLQ